MIDIRNIVVPILMHPFAKLGSSMLLGQQLSDVFKSAIGEFMEPKIENKNSSERRTEGDKLITVQTLLYFYAKTFPHTNITIFEGSL